VVLLALTCSGVTQSAATAAVHAPARSERVRAAARDTLAAHADRPIALGGVEISALRPMLVSVPRRFGILVGGTPAAYCAEPSGVRAGYALIQCLDMLPYSAGTSQFTGAGIEFPAGHAQRAYLESGRVLMRNPVDVIVVGSEVWVTSAGFAVHF